MTPYLPRLLLIGVLLAAGMFLSKRLEQSFSRSSSALLPACEAEGVGADGRKCYEDYLIDLLKKEGGAIAVTQMGKFEEKSPIVKTYCHGIAHNLGHAGYELYGNLQEALSNGSMDCFAGYFHGAIEVALPEAADYNEAIRTACSRTSQKDGEFRFYQCVHGLGHGVIAYRQYDIEGALGDCDLLATAWQRESCHGGVFMENIDSKFVTAMGFQRQGNLQDDDSDFWPCLSVDEGYRSPCLKMITARILPKHNRNFSYASGACDSLDVARYRSLCFESYGRDAAGEALHTELSKVNELCDQVPADVKSTCYETGAAVIATHFADPSRADPICARAGESKAACEAGKMRIAESLAG